MKLESGDILLGYSNSLSECRDADNQYLGVEGLLDRLKRINVDNPSQLASSLAAQVQHENDANLASDDATIVLSQVTDNAVGWKDSFLAPFRLLGGVSDKTHFT